MTREARRDQKEPKNEYNNASVKPDKNSIYDLRESLIERRGSYAKMSAQLEKNKRTSSQNKSDKKGKERDIEQTDTTTKQSRMNLKFFGKSKSTKHVEPNANNKNHQPKKARADSPPPSAINHTKDTTKKLPASPPPKRTSSLIHNQNSPMKTTAPDPPTKLQLPQQITEEDKKTKTKEAQLLAIYDDMLKQIKDFKKNQTDAKETITHARVQVNQLRQQKEQKAVEIKHLQVELYDLLKQIKVTDDDLSTIQKKLAALSGKLSNFPPNSKRSFNKKNLKKSDVITFFKNCWTPQLHYSEDERQRTGQNIEHLFQAQVDMDYALVSVLVEKLIMDHFVTYIFRSPIYMDFGEINNAYSRLEGLFLEAKHPEWASNLRLKCVKATLTDIEREPEYEQRSKTSRAKLCEMLLDKLSTLYDRDEIASRIRKLVEMAAELSFPMNSQEERIERIHLSPGVDFFGNQVKAQYGSDKSPTRVKVGISPVFLVKNIIQLDEDFLEEDDHMISDDEDGPRGEETEKLNRGYYLDNKNYTMVYTGRAIGYADQTNVLLEKPNAK